MQAGACSLKKRRASFGWNAMMKAAAAQPEPLPEMDLQ